MVREFSPGALEFGALGIASGVFRLAVLLPALVLRRGLLSFADLSLGRSGELLYLSSLCLFHKLACFVLRNSPLCFSGWIWAHCSPACFPAAPVVGVPDRDVARGGASSPTRRLSNVSA